MIVWGGYHGDGPEYSGGVYDPATDSWTRTSIAGAPSEGSVYTAVWTGDRMIVWGGEPASDELGLYCAGCSEVFTHYRDADGDGWGDAGATIETCDPAPLAGYLADAGDCDDGDPAISPPGEAAALRFVSDKSTLVWAEPQPTGGSPLTFDTLRSPTPFDFSSATCIESNNGSDRQAVDPAGPLPGEAYYYLVRAENTCGSGRLGRAPDGTWRTGVACP